MLENFRTQKIIWDRANKKIFEKIEANSGDSNGRKLVVQVINQEATEVISGTTLSLGWKSRNGAKGLDAFNVVDASKGIFEIYYTTEMLSNIGNIESSLILIDSTSRIESSTFTISVRPSTVDDESVESENSFTALTEALVKVNDFDAQLARKADKNKVRENTYDKPINVSEMDTETKQLFTGGAVAVVGEKAVGTENIKDSSVTTGKLDDGAITSGKLARSVTDGIALESKQLIYGENVVTNGTIVGNTGLTSTFSGYGGFIGSFENINIIELSLMAINPNLIPKNIRIIFRFDDYQGAIVYDTKASININTASWSTVIVPVEIENPTGRAIWMEYHTDGRVANQTVGRISDVPSLMRYSTRASLTDLTMVDNQNSGNRHIYVKVYSLSDSLNEKFKGAINKDFKLPTTFVDTQLFDNSFDRFIERTVTNKSTDNVTELYTTSTFSGWGSIMYPTPNKVSAVRLKFKNRDIPVTKAKLYITRKDKNGEILAESQDSEVRISNSKPNEEVIVDWKLDSTINNDIGDYLYLSYQTDQFINLLAVVGPSQSKESTTYGYLTYNNNGVISVPSGLKDLYASTNIHYLWYEEYIYHDELYIPNENVLAQIGTQSGSGTSNVRVVLPDEINAVVGDNLQLFYRGIVEAVDPYQYDIRATSTKGRHYPRYFEFKPTSSDIGTHDLKIEVRDNSGKLIGEDTTKLKVVSAKSPATQKNILAIGDSLTAEGTWVKEARRRLMGSGGVPVGDGLSNFNFIGTRSNGTTGWEGTGGWKWDNYLTGPSPTTSDIEIFVNSHDKTLVDQKSLWEDSNGNVWELETIEPTKLKFNRVSGNTSVPPTGAGVFTHQSSATNTGNITYTSLQFADGNPFWDAELGKVSFKSYCERNGFSGIDYLYTLLTWNGGRSDKATEMDNAAEINQAKELIDILHAEYPNAQVRMMGVQLPSLNGGTGANYSASSHYSNTYGLVRGVFGLNLAYQEFANRDGYKDFVKFVNVSSQFDSENLMPETTKPVNNRSSLTERFGTNGVHPTTEGYYAIGDVAYRSILGDV